MLNPFPTQFLALFAYFILRIFVGGLLLWLGVKILRTPPIPRPNGISERPLLLTTLALLEIAVGSLLLIGAYTQYAALVLALLSIGVLITDPHRHHPFIPHAVFYLLTLGCALTLFITGAGFPAVDLPI